MKKKQQQRGKNSLYKPLWAISLVVAILCISPVLAETFTFDNIKQYDEKTQTITIVNTLGLGRDISTIQLKTPLKYIVPAGYQKVAEFEIDLFDDTYPNAFEKMVFINNLNGKKIERKFDYKYFTTETIVYNCVDNKTEECKVYEEHKQVWKDFDTKTLLKGKVTIGIFTEVYIGDNVEWIPTLFGKKINEWATFIQSSGTKTYQDIGGVNYTIETFTSNGYFNTTGSDLNVSVLVIAGGAGGGGDGSAGRAGGGGAGGYEYQNSFSVTAGNYNVFVGAGGVAKANGVNSSFSTIIAIGGGYGSAGFNGGDGGAGGGCWEGFTGGTGSQGGDGGVGGGASYYGAGGGGGAGANGQDGTTTNGGDGGIGIQNNISGTNIYYAGGGGGGIYSGSNNSGDGGAGGGGSGGNGTIGQTIGGAGIVNTGGGGGGAGFGGSQSGGAGGSGVIIIKYKTSINKTLTITLNSPTQYENFTNAEMVFDTDVYTYFDDLLVENVSLILDGELNDTSTNGVNGTYQFLDAIVSDGKHNWSILAYGNNSESTQSDTREFWVDTINPVINLISPLNNSVIISTTATYNISLNATVTDTNLDACWYNNGTDNITFTCVDNVTVELGEGWRTLIWYANDTFGNEGLNSTTFYINYIQDSLDFTDPIIEGQDDLIVFNLTATNIDSLTAILEYNNTNYTMEGPSNSTYGELNYTITAPTVAANTEIPLRVYYTLNDLNYTSSDYNQTVYFITPIEVAETCSAGLSPAMFFNFTQAQNLTQIVNGSVDYNFKMGITDTTEKVTTGTLDNVNWFYLCINSTIYNNYTLGYGEIDYSKTGYSDRRWYAFNNQRLSNTTINNSLYFLPTGSSTSFLITIQQPTLTPYQNVYTSLLRWYSAIDDYKIVEMGKTDDKGQTVKKIEVEDIDYRIGIYEQDGTLIYLASPIRMVCIASPCSYTLTVTSTTGVAYTNFLGVVGTLVYDEGVFLYTYNDPSQTTSNIYLNVSRVSGSNEILLCQDTSSSFTGILTCNVTGQQGLLKGIVYRSASPEKALDILWVDNSNTIFQSTTGLFFVMIIVLALFLIGIYYPIASILLGLLALIPALFLKVITYPILVGIAVLAGIVIHFMKETTR